MPEQMWNKEIFRQTFFADFEKFTQTLSSDAGDWVVKGFIDIYRNIYSISGDTKIISKLIELMAIPAIVEFAKRHDYQLVLSEHQNYYPDISLIAPEGTKIAVDLKSTYRVSANRVNGFTLGAFTGYFRDRTSTKNITFPYQSYAAHFVLGILYSRTDGVTDERRVYTLDEMLEIVSVIRDFQFLLQEKWRIAYDHPGSGNTKNIGSIKEIQALMGGHGPFEPYGEAVFADYWTNYLTRDMARAIDSTVPYRNLDEYWQWRERVPLRKLRDS